VRWHAVGAAVTAVLAVGSISGCSGSGSSTSTSVSAPSKAAIAQQAGFEPNEVAGYTGPAGCDIAEIFNTPQEIDLYRGAGDTVVTDPSGSIGAKVVDPGCAHPVELALERVDLGG
jgi:hypothetical protein